MNLLIWLFSGIILSTQCKKIVNIAYHNISEPNVTYLNCLFRLIDSPKLKDIQFIITKQRGKANPQMWEAETSQFDQNQSINSLINLLFQLYNQILYEIATRFLFSFNLYSIHLSDSGLCPQLCISGACTVTAGYQAAYLGQHSDYFHAAI